MVTDEQLICDVKIKKICVGAVPRGADPPLPAKQQWSHIMVDARSFDCCHECRSALYETAPNLAGLRVI